MKKVSLFLIFIIRVISGIVIFRQGLEKFTGDFTLNGLVPVIRDIPIHLAGINGFLNISLLIQQESLTLSFLWEKWQLV